MFKYCACIILSICSLSVWSLNSDLLMSGDSGRKSCQSLDSACATECGFIYKDEFPEECLDQSKYDIKGMSCKDDCKTAACVDVKYNLCNDEYKSAENEYDRHEVYLRCLALWSGSDKSWRAIGEYVQKNKIGIFNLQAEDDDDNNATVLTECGLPADKIESASEKAYVKEDFFVRRNIQDVSMLEDDINSSGNQGALLSYTRNIEDDSSIWELRGLLAYSRIYSLYQPDKKSNSRFSRWAFTPTLLFDRVSNENTNQDDKPVTTDDGSAEEADDEDVSRLSFAPVFEFEWFDHTGEDILNAHYLRLIPEYTTDFEFKSSIISLATEWEPVAIRRAIGAGRSIGNLGFLRFRPVFRTEFGEVLDAGDNAALQDTETFARFGAVLSLEYRPRIKLLRNNLSLKVDYRYLTDLTGESESSDLFEASATYSFEGEKIGLEFSYRNGDAPIVEIPTETFKIGLTAKF